MKPLSPSVSLQASLPFALAGARVELLTCGALWWPETQLLVVSDLHLEKGSAYAARGQMLPPYDTRATLARLAQRLVQLAPAMVISLGDSFHDRGARARMAPDDVVQIRKLTAETDWVWIEGNHDPRPPEDLGGRWASTLTIGALTFRHEPAPGKAPGEVAGHLHPCALVAGRGRAVRVRCFATDGERLVMPAYGALTGGLNVRDEAFARLFPSGPDAAAIGRDGVYLVARDRLASDRVRAAG